MRVAADVHRATLPHVPHERVEGNRRDEPLHQLLGVARVGECEPVVQFVGGALILHRHRMEAVAEGFHRAVRATLRGVLVVDLAVE